eukprot:Platyproteum_vivax@DN12631_c0_g1_i1.p1
MPPVYFKVPDQIRLKAPISKIVPILEPDIKLGKSIVAALPHRVTAKQIENSRRVIRRIIGRRKEFFVNIHATYAVSRKPPMTKQGQGKGDIHHFVARVPAGRTMFYLPSANPFPGFLSPYVGLKDIVNKMPMHCNLRAQFNFFPMDKKFTHEASLPFFNEKTKYVRERA